LNLQSVISVDVSWMLRHYFIWIFFSIRLST